MINPIVHIGDQFFVDPDRAYNDILSEPFVDITNPMDGLVYTDINQNIPEVLKREIVNKLAGIMGFKIKPNYIFARTMIKGKQVLNKVHSDHRMATYTALVYLSKEWPEYAGTGFFKHATQGYWGDPQTDWTQIDHNSMTNWERLAFAQAKFNRVVIFDSRYWHMAEPNEAWGTDAKTGRTVLTCFFDRKYL